MTIRVHQLGNPYLFAGVGIAIASLLFAWYLAQIQGLTEAAYHVSILESQAKGLQRQLQAKRSASQALSLETLAEEMGFERAGAIRYIRILEPSVAQNR